MVRPVEPVLVFCNHSCCPCRAHYEKKDSLHFAGSPFCRVSPNLRSCFPCIAARGGGDTSLMVKQRFFCSAVLGPSRWASIAVFTTATAINKSAVNMIANSGHVMSAPTAPAMQGPIIDTVAIIFYRKILARPSSSYPRIVERTVLIQICCPARAGVPSFPRRSCSRLQVQTVPSSQWDAPCPVVTPSHTGLARRFLPIHYTTLSPFLHPEHTVSHRKTPDPVNGYGASVERKNLFAPPSKFSELYNGSKGLEFQLRMICSYPQKDIRHKSGGYL